MDYFTALDAIIRRGIEGVNKSFADEPHKRDGSIEGFDACRDKTPLDLFDVLDGSRKRTAKAKQASQEKLIEMKDYWKVRYAEIQVEWVCNCVAVMIVNQGQKSPFPRHVGPTARAAIFVASVVGVAAPD
jgi:hypothetical protein